VRLPSRPNGGSSTGFRISGLIGGLLLGSATALLLWLNGRLAGISGIVGGLLAPKSGRGLARYRIEFSRRLWSACVVVFAAVRRPIQTSRMGLRTPCVPVSRLA